MSVIDPTVPSPWFRLDADDRPSRLTWGEYLLFDAPLSTEAQRRVEETSLAHPDGRRAWVSTVYLGMDSGPGRENDPPVLWETMVFSKDDPADLWQQRYASVAEARDGHRSAVAGLVDVGYVVTDDEP